MTKPRQRRPAITAIEVVVTIAVCGGLLTLLLPALASSRESARANLCRRNLRRLDLSAIELELSGAPPTDWPTRVLREVPSDGNDSYESLHMPRPYQLTCPSRPNEVIKKWYYGHYVRIYHSQYLAFQANSTNSNRTSEWIFGDRELDIPPEERKNDYWAAGSTVAQDPPWRSPKKGPHADGSYLRTDGQGGVVVRLPNSKVD